MQISDNNTDFFTLKDLFEGVLIYIGLLFLAVIVSIFLNKFHYLTIQPAVQEKIVFEDGQLNDFLKNEKNFISISK